MASAVVEQSDMLSATNPRCIICEDDEPSPATAACTECRIYLCDFDALMHKGTPATRLHQLLRLKPLSTDIPPMTSTPTSTNHHVHISGRGIGHISDLTCSENKEVTRTSPLPPLLTHPRHTHKRPLHEIYNTTVVSEEEETITPIDSDSSSTNSPRQTQTNDEEAFINFVKEFKYPSPPKATKPSPNSTLSDRQRTPSLHTDDDDGDYKLPKRAKKAKDDDEAKAWESNFVKLVDYRERFGNCYVPYDWNEDTQFAQWVSRQRVFKNKGKLPQDRVKRLETIGFIWSANEAGAFKMRWEQRLEELKQYKSLHGTCAVPYRWPKNTQLANWVFRQREHRKAGKLSEERITQLDEVGFLWGVDISVSKDHRWEMKFTELKEYKGQHGHCRVPNAYRINQQLANWVRKQRELRKKGRLTRERIDRLDATGFVWEIGQGKPSNRGRTIEEEIMRTIMK